MTPKEKLLLIISVVLVLIFISFAFNRDYPTYALYPKPLCGVFIDSLADCEVGENCLFVSCGPQTLKDLEPYCDSIRLVSE